MLSIFGLLKAWELYRTASHHTVVLVLPSCTSSSSNPSIGIPCVIPLFIQLFNQAFTSLNCLTSKPTSISGYRMTCAWKDAFGQRWQVYIRKNIDSHFGWIGGDIVVASLHVFAVVLRFRVFRMVVETSKAFEVESSSMIDNTDPGQSDNSRLLDTSGWKAIVIVNCKYDMLCHNIDS